MVGSVGTEASAALRDQGIAYRPGATIGLTGLQKARNHDLAGTPTIQVVAETATGRKVSVLQSWPGQPSRPVRTTIDAGLQTAADGALAALPASAAVIAIQASTGHILTVAGHTQPGPRRGRPAGWPVPARAGLHDRLDRGAAGRWHAGEHARCPAIRSTTSVANCSRNVPREQSFGSQPPFSADFAHACGTAFSGLSLGLTGRDLTSAAARFGLGARWQLPLPSFSGAMRSPGSVAAVAAGTIGEGNVQVSPLAMALVAAQVDSGSQHEPSLIITPGDPPAASKTAAPSVRPTWPPCAPSCGPRSTRVPPGRRTWPGSRCMARWGRSMYRPGKHPVWATWFVGYRGDVALAVLELSRSASASAAPLAAQILGAAG